MQNIIDSFNQSYQSTIEADENEQSYIFSMELPGFEKKEVCVSLKSDQLMIHAKSDKKEKSKSITLPSDIDTGKISAKLKNGVLRITVPKAKRSSHIISIN